MKETSTTFRWGAVLIMLVTILICLPAVGGRFLWDDDEHLTHNPAMTSTRNALIKLRENKPLGPVALRPTTEF